MKKLLQINPVVRENTSTGKIMRALGELAMTSGWESYIAYSRGRDGVPSHNSQLVPVGNRLDVLLHFLATRLLDAHGLASRLSTRRLIRHIRAIDPDIVHIHNVHGYFLHYPSLLHFLAERGKPVVWTVHDCWLFTGHCYHYAAAGCGKWQTGCHHCPQRGAFPRSWLVDGSARNFRKKKAAIGGMPNLTLVTVSAWMRAAIGQSFLKDKPCRVIPNGIDLDVFKPRLAQEADVRTRYGISAPVFYLAVASIWLKEKGVNDLAALATLLSDDEQLVLVGQMDAVGKAAFPAGVVFMDRTEDAGTLAALYSAATALVNPTWQDNYPTVNLEAIACGTPVVTYRTGGSPEALTPETGRVVAQGDVAGLATALRELRARDRSYLRASCREQALARFGREDRFKDYLSLYEDLATR